jgi:long-chain acyl-CoA synthetase
MRTAVSFGSVSLTYGQLDRQSLEIGAGLQEMGIEPQDRVAAFIPNCLEIYQLYFATAAARGIFLAINQALSVPEAGFLMGHAEPKVIFTRPALRSMIDEALAIAGHEAEVIELDDGCPSGSQLSFLAKPGQRPKGNPEPEDVVLINYSSGTTAKPKAIGFSNRVEVDGCELYREAWDLNSTDRVLIALSLGWTYGINPGSFPAFRAGAEVVLLEKFHPVKALQTIQDRKITVFMGVPTMFAMLIEHVQETGKTYDLSSLRLVLTAGAELPSAISDRFAELFGIHLTDFLGISEVKLVASPRIRTGETVPAGSVGRIPPRVQVRLVDEEGVDVGPGEVGEILIKSPGWMAGYFREPEKTTAARRDGWYVSGDLGRFDSNGFFYVVGRTRDQIIRGGAKIAPAEIENALAAHPAVVLSAVIGAPDPRYGEQVIAFVVRRNDEVTEDELRRFCAGRLSEFKVPAKVIFVSDLPIGPTGKVFKRELRSQYAAQQK